jgi:hypothetical protein
MVDPYKEIIFLLLTFWRTIKLLIKFVKVGIKTLSLGPIDNKMNNTKQKNYKRK